MTPTNSATIGHLPDSVPHKQPTLRETAKPHDAVPGSADGSNGLSPHEGIFDLLNHRVGPTYDELPRNSSPHDRSHSLRPDFGEHERSQNKLYGQCLYGEAWCGMVAFSALLPEADLDDYMATARDDTYLARQTLFRAQQVQNAIADEKGRRAMRALQGRRHARRGPTGAEGWRLGESASRRWQQRCAKPGAPYTDLHPERRPDRTGGGFFFATGGTLTAARSPGGCSQYR